MAKRKKKSKQPKAPTWKELEAILKRSAKGAEELDRTLKRIFRLTPSQLRQPLD